jgi:hypothetical protein
MSLSDVIDEVRPSDLTVTILNREALQPVQDLLVEFFEPMSVEVQEGETDAATPADTVLLHDDERPLAVSSLDAIRDSVLMVNADVYATGARPLDRIATPDVITELDTVRIPGERENKLVLIQISRHIEAMAWQAGGGELHSSFQRLSRLIGERGTRRVYRRLGELPVRAHVYGVPDAEVPPEIDVTVHADRTEEIHDSWFVLHDGAGNDGWKAGLVAEAVGPNVYRGFWTFDPDRVDSLIEYVTRTYPPSR